MIIYKCEKVVLNVNFNKRVDNIRIVVTAQSAGAVEYDPLTSVLYDEKQSDGEAHLIVKNVQAHLKKSYKQNVFTNHIFDIYVLRGFSIK